MKKIYFFNSIIFLAAFLLFQIELIISKVLLPKFGGSYLVWGACVVFFQCALLFGYIYSHVVIQKIRIFRYRYLHLVLFFLPLLYFPGRPLGNIYSYPGIPMVIDVFGLLLFTVGLVFFVLSTTSVIFQSWLSSSQLAERSNPYALYAVSNLGSFLALLTYPFFFEANFDLETQLNIWRICYLILLVFHIIVFRSVKVIEEPTEHTQPADGILTTEKLRLFLLSAASVVAFLSVTSIITYEITPAPLLWIIPLCIYLVAFVLNFKKEPFCPAWIKDKFHLTVAFNIMFFFFTQKRIIPVMFELIVYSISLFVICMFCQNELFRRKPLDNRKLTDFYLIIATGSFVGGVLTSWIFPLISAMMIEYLFSFIIIYYALTIGEQKKPLGMYFMRLIFYLLSLIIFWPLVFNKGYNFLGVIIIFFLLKFIYEELKESRPAIFFSLISVFFLAPFLDSAWSARDYIYTHRNYYGIYKIFEKDGARFLLNGTTLHGAQLISPKKEMMPITYYHHLTPLGKLFNSNIFDFRRIGVVGLGIGSLAAYGKKEQVVDFFELDHDVFDIANKYFSFLKNSPAKINYTFGDARVSLGRVSDKRYDLLVIDAFSGDSVPVHLLTAEAISEYKRLITKDGIILFHVSNRYVNLVPVLFSNAKLLNAQPCVSSNRDKTGITWLCSSVWVALTWSPDSSNHLTSELKWQKKYSINQGKYLRPWTDLYSNILSAFKFRNLFNSVKTFQPFYWE